VHGESTGEMYLGLKNTPQPARSTLRAIPSPTRSLTVSRHSKLWEAGAAHPPHAHGAAAACPRPLKYSQDTATSPGSATAPGSFRAPGVPELFLEGKGRISSTRSFDVEVGRVCHSFIWVRLSPPTILQEKRL